MILVQEDTEGEFIHDILPVLTDIYPHYSPKFMDTD